MKKKNTQHTIYSKQFLLLIVYCLLSAAYCSAQDIHFSQYDFSPLTLNPALTAAYKDIQATIQHKEQWRALNGYQTSAATFEMKFGQPNWTKVKNTTGTFKAKLKKGLATGLTFFSDRAGDAKMRQFQANLSIAYHALLNANNTLSTGLIGGVAQKSISPDDLRWNNQYTSGVYDPSASSGEKFSNQSFVYGDFGAGILWSYSNGSSYMSSNDQKQFHAGLSVMHLNSPPQSYLAITSDRLDPKWTGHIGSLFGIKNSNYSIGPSLLYMQQGKNTELTTGMLIKYKLKENSMYTGFIKSSAFGLGCYYRNKDAVIPYFLYEVDKYSIGMSYDVNLSGLKTATSGRGGFEISLRFNTPSSFVYQTKSSL